MILKKFLPAMILILGNYLFPTCSVSGYVKEINTDIPIPIATIYIFEDNKYKDTQERDLYIVKTDKKGFFNITISDPGDYSIFVEIPVVGIIGYAFAGGPNFHDFKIKKDQELKFIFLIGKSKIPILEKKISEDGNTIYFKMLHDKSDKSNRLP
ncbi:MAG: hypothetical protein JSV88_26205 [Candidatus Aminicenantes bacterium]|nr:MAG: hypothetical protein JSV88_26205 [Candidatus Aminicenantes bacterium]